jgi:hypothetical protein
MKKAQKENSKALVPEEMIFMMKKSTSYLKFTLSR